MRWVRRLADRLGIDRFGSAGQQDFQAVAAVLRCVPLAFLQQDDLEEVDAELEAMIRRTDWREEAFSALQWAIDATEGKGWQTRGSLFEIRRLLEGNIEKSASDNILPHLNALSMEFARK